MRSRCERPWPRRLRSRGEEPRRSFFGVVPLHFPPRPGLAGSTIATALEGFRGSSGTWSSGRPMAATAPGAPRHSLPDTAAGLPGRVLAVVHVATLQRRVPAASDSPLAVVTG